MMNTEGCQRRGPTKPRHVEADATLRISKTCDHMVPGARRAGEVVQEYEGRGAATLVVEIKGKLIHGLGAPLRKFDGLKLNGTNTILSEYLCRHVSASMNSERFYCPAQQAEGGANALWSLEGREETALAHSPDSRTWSEDLIRRAQFTLGR